MIEPKIAGSVGNPEHSEISAGKGREWGRMPQKIASERGGALLMRSFLSRIRCQ